MEGQECTNNVAVVMVPFPAQGHLNQLLHLSHIVSSYGFHVHCAGSSEHNRQAKLRHQGWHSGAGDGPSNKIHFHDFELPPHESPPPNPDPNIRFPAHLLPMWEASMNLRQPVSELLRELSSQFRRIVVVYDTMMTYVVHDVQHISNAESYRFVPSSAFNVFLSVYDAMHQKLPFEINSDVIPECDIPFNESGFPPEMTRLVTEYVVRYMGFEKGSLYNTSRVIEGKYVELLEKLSGNNKKCFAIGPFHLVNVAKQEIETKRNEFCLEWLGKQERNSVIYVSFGTQTSISDDQIRELAVGLEKSEQKFIWALRDADKSNVFAENDAFRRPNLPDGFEERVKNRGIVVRDWAPQLEILAHSSTGGFLSHCRWNSCMESITAGVAIAAWPMHSDQPKNSVLVTEVLRIGTMVKDWARLSELISSTDVESAVRRLMASEEGEEMRKRAAELGVAVRKSASIGGSSLLEMDSFIAHITR